MAPKGGRGGGGGGGGRGGGGIRRCSDNAFQNHVIVTYMVYYVLFTVVVIAILMAAGSVKKKHPHANKLLGGTYTTALFFLLLGHLLYWISLVVGECDASAPYDAPIKMAIAYAIFWWVAEMLLLVVAIGGLNTALCQRMGARRQILFQTISWVVLGIVGILGATYIALDSYNTWTRTSDAHYDDLPTDKAVYVGLSYQVLYLAASMIGGTLALLSLSRLRSQASVNALIGGVIVLTISLMIPAFIQISSIAQFLEKVDRRLNTILALHFIDRFFAHLAFITLLFIAKSATFKQQMGLTQYSTYIQPAHTQPEYNPQQPAQLPNNQPVYYGQPQLDGTQRHEVKG